MLTDPLTPPPLAPPTAPTSVALPPIRWPLVLGIITMVFGACALLGALSGVVAGLFPSLLASIPGQTPEALAIAADYAPFSISYSIFALGIASMLLIGGAQLVKWRASAPRLLRAWAIAKMVLVPVGVVLATFLQHAQLEVMKNDPQFANNPALAGGWIVFFQIFGAVFGLLWGWALPIFMLCWLGSRRIKADIAMWE